jgi:hypothetical protein
VCVCVKKRERETEKEIGVREKKEKKKERKRERVRKRERGMYHPPCGVWRVRLNGAGQLDPANPHPLPIRLCSPKSAVVSKPASTAAAIAA